MRLIIDSHILLALTPRRRVDLDARIAAVLRDPNSRVWISVVSLWEIAIKTRLGKLDPGMPLDDLPPYGESLGVDLFCVTASHAVAGVDPLPPTRDPFDRMLLAQCLVEGCKLVTLDGAMRHHPLALRIS